MLSAQTTDEQVNKTTHTLFKKYPKFIDYVHTKPSVFARDIRSINYYKTKAKHICATAKLLHTRYNGILPKTVKDIMQFPGVGRKTALVVLGNAYNIVEGIAVDTHVQRLSRVFGLTNYDKPEQIEQDLQKLFPKREWFHLTNRMISYGRMYCPARCKHDSCPIYKKLNS